MSVFYPKDGESIIEIGPGTGALTEALLNRIRALTAIELDRDLIGYLREKFGAEESKELTVIESDILRFNFSSLIEQKEEGQKLRIIGNLPYNISTPLIFCLLEYVEIIQDMVFMLQREVAMRLSAQPGNKHYGRLTVMTAIDLHSECLFDVPPGAFNPPPKVDSTVIRMWPRKKQFEIDCRSSLAKIVSAAFSQRRKTIRNGLRKLISEDQFEIANIDPKQRAENLSVEDFVTLSNVYSRDL